MHEKKLYFLYFILSCNIGRLYKYLKKTKIKNKKTENNKRREGRRHNCKYFKKKS